MGKFKEGTPLALSYGTFVNLEKGVDDNGNPYVNLYFLSYQALPSVGLKMAPEQVLAGYKGKSEKEKPWNLKFKITQDRQELTIGLEIGQTYWIEHASGQSSFGDSDGKHRSYESRSLYNVSKLLPEDWKDLIRVSQSSNGTTPQVQQTAGVSK